MASETEVEASRKGSVSKADQVKLQYLAVYEGLY
jgi:hypothetical protein